MKFQEGTHHPIVELAVEITARFGFLSRDCFWKQVTNSKRSSTFKIWKRLTDSGLFIPFDSTLKGRFLKLSENGRAFAKDKKLQLVDLPSFKQLAHDDLLMTLALALEDAKLIHRALPEIYYKTVPQYFSLDTQAHQKKIPDLYFSLNVPDKNIRVAAEYEKTRKVETKYRSILLNYATFKEVDLVLFIVVDDRIEKVIKRVAARIRYPNHNRPLAFAYASDVVQNPTEFQMRFEKRTVKFSRFVEDMRQVKLGAA